MRVHVSSKFKILEVSNRRCLQHRVSETILNLVNEANVEGYLSQSSLSTLFLASTRRLGRQKLQEMQTKRAD